MERVIGISKQMMLGLTSGQFWHSFNVSPKLHTQTHKPLVAPVAPNYEVRDDHLFLPEVASIRKALTRPTIISLYLIGFASAFSLVVLANLFSISVLLVISTVVTLFYFSFMFFKLLIIAQSLRTPMETVSDAELKSLDSITVPMYTVLVPLRDEAEVMDQIVAAMEQLEYPRERLEILVTVEQFDHSTKEALAKANLPDHWRVIELPDTAPKTKPKALNCAFLDARGEYLVIFDAEIIPEPTQLKKALCVFAENPTTAILQPRLDHYNTYQNLLTRLFTIEFTFHYDLFLPGLAKFNLPVPLSGHSTHFRMSAVHEAGAWDPYNVAEDCEIGMRLYRLGYRSSVFDSISMEEAASTISSWIKQRTRWMKGFIQTTIVHLRYARATRRQMGGWKNFLVFLLVVPGTVLVNLLNIFMVSLLLTWVVFQPEFVQSLYPLPVLYTANIVAIVGSFLFIYFTMISLYRRGKFDLVRWWFFQPLYWALLSYATMRAVIQLFTAPHVWEKTEHGTHLKGLKSSHETA